MNLRTNLRRRRVVIPAIAAVAALGAGGTVWTATASDDIQGAERDRVAEAAAQAAGGTAVDVETSDDLGEAYEVEVRQADGTEVDVSLDKDLKVLSQDVEAADEADEAGGAGEAGDDSDGDERAVSADERASAEKAALDAAGGGTVVEVEADDDPGQGYEVEVVDGDNTEWEVDLGPDFTVLQRSADD